MELAEIGIDIEDGNEGNGDNCQPGDWTTLHWTATLEDNRVVSDSRSENGGAPKTFALGKSEVFRCWDLAIPQLKSGTKARVSCPSKFAWGGHEADSPLGGEPIPKNTDVVFDLEVVDCNKAPENQLKKRDK